jgi:oxygen-dependent protoporphyrinogen oxidase
VTAYAGLRLLVVGGGITGLAAAWEASIQGAEVLLVEASDRFGGKLRTEHVDGLAIEAGPDSFVAYRPAALTLVRELGLGEEVVEVRGGRTVHLRTDGRLQPIPDGMGLVLPTKLGPFVRTPVLRWRHKARALLDLVLPRRLGASDVAIGDLLRARLGEGIVQRFADPMLGGIYGASVDELSLDAVLPILREHERTHRSLIIASLASGRAARAVAQSTSGSGGTTRGPSSPFRSLATGLGALPDRLVDALTERGADLRRHTRVDALTPEGEQTRVRLSDGTEHVVDGVVLAAGAAASADLVEPYAASAAAALRQVRHASTAVVTVAWPESAFAAPPTSQGWLEAGDAPVSGVTISSAKWPGRAPAGVVLVRAFVPDRVGRLARGSDGEILDAVTRHVSGILGAHQPPTLTRVTRWVGVMPKYTVGHLDRVAAVDAGLAGQPSWTVAGSALRGVGIPDCIADGRAAVSRVLGSRKATAAAASPTTATPTSTATPTTASPTITAPQPTPERTPA